MALTLIKENQMEEEVKEILDQMEVLLNKGAMSYEEEDKLQDLYVEAERYLQISDKTIFYDTDDEHGRLRKRFRGICSRFETPDDIRNATLDMMFPDEDSDEGFDY